MAAGVCVMVLVLAAIVASFLFDLHAYLVARRPRHARRRRPDDESSPGPSTKPPEPDGGG